MKKLIACVSLTVLLFSCHSNNALEKRDIQTDSILSDSSVRLSEASESPRCSVSLNIKYIKGGDNATKLNEAFIKSGIIMPGYVNSIGAKGLKHVVDSFVKEYLSDYKEFYSRIYKNDKNDAALFENRYTLNTRISSERDDVITYTASLSMYGGGLYETHQTLVRNFNADTGKLITLSDLFMHGYEKTLKSLITNKMLDKFDVNDINELRKNLIFADGNVYVPDNFILEHDGITFIYCEDEIAPHEKGEIRIKIDEDEIENIKLSLKE